MPPKATRTRKVHPVMQEYKDAWEQYVHAKNSRPGQNPFLAPDHQERQKKRYEETKRAAETEDEKGGVISIGSDDSSDDSSDEED